MIDRESAEKITAGIRDGSIRPETLSHALLMVLDAGLGREPNRIQEGSAMEDRLSKFFDTIVEVAPIPPKPYDAAEVAILARHSQGKVLLREKGAERSMKSFYRSIARDYGDMAEIAEGGNLKGAIRFYDMLDTADRENFGWGGDGWDEERWYTTQRENVR